MDDHTQIMLSRMRSLSETSLSMLQAALQGHNAGLASGAGSANEGLWRDMQARGWMTCRENKVQLRGGVVSAFRVFSITPAGQQPIERLLSECARRRLL